MSTASRIGPVLALGAGLLVAHLVVHSTGPVTIVVATLAVALEVWRQERRRAIESTVDKPDNVG